MGKQLVFGGIPVEILKALGCTGPTGKHELFEICLDIYRKAHSPRDFMESIIIPIEKKQRAKECVDFKIISLIPLASKILLKILTWHLQVKADDFLGPDQYGFRKGCGTRDAIAALRVMCERSLENNYKVHVCYVDFEKSFDRINWVN